MQRNVFGPLPEGTYTLTGWTKLQSGSGDFKVMVSFAYDTGEQGGMQLPISRATGSDYTSFTVSSEAGLPVDHVSVTFELDPQGGDAELCIDDLLLTTDDVPPTSTPVPTATTTPTPSPTTLPSATTTPTRTATASPSATKSPTPTSTLTPAPSFVFTNGGFEDGLTGWSKYGGSLSTTANALTGSRAGLLTSSTDSTKWAFQEVRVDPARYYEFGGNVQADDGVNVAYLRISWYPTSDASGSAMSSTDSVEQAGPGGATFLTTGAVQPPPGAVTARLRVVMTPNGASPAALRIDDVSFGETAPPTPTPTPSPTSTTTPIASETPVPTPTFALLGAANPTTAPDDNDPPPEHADATTIHASAASGTEDLASATVAESPTSVPVAEVASSRATASSAVLPTTAPLSRELTRPSKSSSGLSWPWVVGIGLFAFGLGGVVLQNRRPSR